MNDSDATSMLLRGARVVLPEGVAKGKSLLIEGNQITRVADEEESVTAGSTLDLKGLTLLPGFVDVHIHGAVGVDTMTANSDDLHRVGRYLASKGTTAWLPTLVPSPDDNYRRAVDAIEELMRQQDARPPAARVVGLHYEGPFISQQKCGALRTQFFRSYTKPSDLERLPTMKVENAARMMTLAPELEGGVELIRELNQRGWVVSIGHTQATVDVLDEAYAAGAHHITHFMNAMPPLHHRTPGPVAWGLANDQVTCDIIADGVHIDPIVLSLLMRVKTSDRLTLISDSIAATGKGDGSYEIWGETIAVKDGRTSNARGTIAGSVISMDGAVRMVSSLGASETQIARMAAFNPSRLIGLDAVCGSIEEGKLADLVGMDEGGNVRLTIVGGRLAFQN